MQDPKKVAKNRHLGTIPQLCRAISLQLRHVSTIRKKAVKQQYLPYMSPQYGELRPTSGWDRFVSLGHPCKFQRVSRLGSVTARHSSSARQPNFAALNRRRHLYSAGRPSRWALAHILVVLWLSLLLITLLFWNLRKKLLLSWKTDQDGFGIIIIIIITNAKIIVTLSRKNAAMAPFKIP